MYQRSAWRMLICLLALPCLAACSYRPWLFASGKPLELADRSNAPTANDLPLIFLPASESPQKLDCNVWVTNYSPAGDSPAPIEMAPLQTSSGHTVGQYAVSTQPGMPDAPKQAPVNGDMPFAPLGANTPGEPELPSITLEEPVHGFFPRLRSYMDESRQNIRDDLRNYYNCRNAGALALGLGMGAVLANTTMDEHFRYWYQQNMTGHTMYDLSAFWTQFGQGKVYIPGFVGLALVGNALGDRPLFGAVGDYSDRVSRAYLVGFPPVLLMQFTLGASRPGERPHASQWRPFQDDNAVSGHAFVGSIPFITAAQMSDDYWAKGLFYFMSVLPAWGRVNDDKHYLSQACLGWWMGYLACSAVNRSEETPRSYQFQPLVTTEITGVALTLSR